MPFLSAALGKYSRVSRPSSIVPCGGSARTSLHLTPLYVKEWVRLRGRRTHLNQKHPRLYPGTTAIDENGHGLSRGAS